jgi:hypothetical protein
MSYIHEDYNSELSRIFANMGDSDDSFMDSSPDRSSNPQLRESNECCMHSVDSPVMWEGRGRGGSSPLPVLVMKPKASRASAGGEGIDYRFEGYDGVFRSGIVVGGNYIANRVGNDNTSGARKSAALNGSGGNLLPSAASNNSNSGSNSDSWSSLSAPHSRHISSSAPRDVNSQSLLGSATDVHSLLLERLKI